MSLTQESRDRIREHWGRGGWRSGRLAELLGLDRGAVREVMQELEGEPRWPLRVNRVVLDMAEVLAEAQPRVGAGAQPVRKE